MKRFYTIRHHSNAVLRIGERLMSKNEFVKTQKSWFEEKLCIDDIYYGAYYDIGCPPFIGLWGVRAQSWCPQLATHQASGNTDLVANPRTAIRIREGGGGGRCLLITSRLVNFKQILSGEWLNLPVNGRWWCTLPPPPFALCVFCLRNTTFARLIQIIRQ